MTTRAGSLVTRVSISILSQNAWLLFSSLVLQTTTNRPPLRRQRVPYKYAPVQNELDWSTDSFASISKVHVKCLFNTFQKREKLSLDIHTLIWMSKPKEERWWEKKLKSSGSLSFGGSSIEPSSPFLSQFNQCSTVWTFQLTWLVGNWHGSRFPALRWLLAWLTHDLAWDLRILDQHAIGFRSRTDAGHNKEQDV